MAHDQPRTAPIIQAIMDLATRSRITAHGVNVVNEVAHKAVARDTFLDAMERELLGVVRPFANRLREVEGMPPWFGETLDRIVGTENAVGVTALGGLVFGLTLAAAQTVTGPILQPLVNRIWDSAPTLPLSPAEAALAVIRGTFKEGDGADEARKSGLDPQRFDVMVKNTGEPPAIQELLFLFRRGKIDQARLEHGIRQSRVRDEWIDAIEALSLQPFSAAEAVQAAVQGHLDPASSQRIYAENGLDPALWEVAFETAGNPPGTQEMIQLYRRGDVDQATLVQAIKESRVKDKYIDAVVKMARRIPPERTVVMMRARGVIDDATALRYLEEDGFNATDAHALLSEADARQTAHHRDATEAMIVAAYRDGIEDRASADNALAALGYTAGARALILANADYANSRKLLDQELAAIRSAYLHRHIDRGAASAAIDATGAGPTLRDRELAAWDLERSVQSREPTVAQLEAAWKAQLLTDAELLDRVIGLGYSELDARLIIDPVLIKAGKAPL